MNKRIRKKKDKKITEAINGLVFIAERREQQRQAAMRRHLCGFSRRNGLSGQSAQRDFFPCSLYRYPLFLPVQIRRTGKIHIQRPLRAERRFFLGVCTCTQRPIQSQNKSRFQSNKAANPLFFSGTSYRTAAFLFAQRQRRDEPCGNGNDCRHASLLLGCHV